MRGLHRHVGIENLPVRASTRHDPRKEANDSGRDYHAFEGPKPRDIRRVDEDERSLDDPCYLEGNSQRFHQHRSGSE